VIKAISAIACILLTTGWIALWCGEHFSREQTWKTFYRNCNAICLSVLISVHVFDWYYGSYSALLNSFIWTLQLYMLTWRCRLQQQLNAIRGLQDLIR
jgi:hypothetical protein